MRHLVQYVIIRWRKQKNGDNGQTIIYARDDALPDFCPVQAALRITLRAQRLHIPPKKQSAKPSTPLDRPIFITD